MNLRMARSKANGVWTPQIMCDLCEKPINDVMLGIVVWYESYDASTDERAWLLHKGTCDLVVSEWHKGQYDFSMELYSVIDCLGWLSEQGKLRSFGGNLAGVRK